MTRATTILNDLADAALMARYCRDGVSETYDVPGRIIQSLSPERRAELQALTSDDLKNIRWPRPDGMNLEKMPRRLR